jgi:RNA polymerase sigma factor (sigma-70 family)
MKDIGIRVQLDNGQPLSDGLLRLCRGTLMEQPPDDRALVWFEDPAEDALVRENDTHFHSAGHVAPQRGGTLMHKNTTNRSSGAGGSGRAGPANSRRAPNDCRVREEGAVSDLVEAAQKADQDAWNALVARYVCLLRAIARNYRLEENDAEDVSQFVWLRLVEQLSRIREPRCLPKWIKTTAQRESQRLAASRKRTLVVDPLVDARLGVEHEQAEVEDRLLRTEERQALRDGLAELPPSQRELLLLLSADPPLSYRHISRVLNIPVGSIGPMRSRSLQRLRATSALRPFLVSSAAAAPSTLHARQAPAA